MGKKKNKKHYSPEQLRANRARRESKERIDRIEIQSTIAQHKAYLDGDD